MLRHLTKVTLGLSLVIVFGLISVVSPSVAADGSLSLNDGVYNKAQAKSGKKLYKKHCVSCHEKGYFDPVFLVWQGQSVGTLYGLISAAMPESSPGSLTADEYADIFAYVLKETGYPVSAEPLVPDSEEFTSIIITPPS